jgi:AmmeMemoRadiSam system protein B
MKRIAANAGAFYPASCQEIKLMITQFNATLDGVLRDRGIVDNVSRAIIAPHAGYIYSGFTANIAHRILANARPRRIIVIGPSHHVYFEGVSVATSEMYVTPCGDLPIDTEWVARHAERFGWVHVPQVHEREHSTETQMPLIHHYNPQASVVELIYGEIDHTELVPVIETALGTPDTAVVISSDLSHFHTLQEAEHLDSICLEGIVTEEVSLLESGCEACGIVGIKAMIEVAKHSGWRSSVLDYRTSADSSGDTQRVVGYASALFLT